MIALPGNIKIDQLAFCAWDGADERMIKAALGLAESDWIEDEVIADGEVDGNPGSNIARLQFNYALGHEVEILQYLDGPNYCELAGIRGGQMCHIGSHFIGHGEVPRLDAYVVQRVVTRSHTNPFLVDSGRHYRYTVYDCRDRLGIFFKVIERL